MLNLEDMPKASGNQMKAMQDAHDKWLATQQQPSQPLQEEFIQQDYPQRQHDVYHATPEDLPAQYQQRNMPDTQRYQAPEQQPMEQPQEDEDAPVTPETKRDYNTRMLREEKERLAQENKELRLWQQQMYQQQNRQPEPPAPIEDESYDIGDEELMEGSKVKQVLRKQEERMQRKFEQAIDQRMANLQQETASLKVNSSFPDFDKVVTAENVAMMERLDPELADMISREPDMFKVKKTVYNQIKRMGIYKEDTFVQQKNIAQANALKPKPSNAVAPQRGDTPMQQANAFANGKPSAEYHKEQMAQMHAARRSA